MRLVAWTASVVLVVLDTPSVETTVQLSYDESEDFHAIRLRCYGAVLFDFEAASSAAMLHTVVLRKPWKVAT